MRIRNQSNFRRKPPRTPINKVRRNLKLRAQEIGKRKAIKQIKGHDQQDEVVTEGVAAEEEAAHTTEVVPQLTTRDSQRMLKSPTEAETTEEVTEGDAVVAITKTTKAELV